MILHEKLIHLRCAEFTISIELMKRSEAKVIKIVRFSNMRLPPVLKLLYILYMIEYITYIQLNTK